MNCISEIVISNIKNIKKKYAIKVIITSFLFCLSVVLLFLITSREYEQLFIILFFILFAILLNLIIYFIVEHINKCTYKIDLYNHLLKINKKRIIATIVEDMRLETYSHVVFHAYKVKDKDEKIYRILIPEDYVLEVNKTYELAICRSVVIYYEEK